MTAPALDNHLHYQVELLTEQAPKLMIQWPKYNMHEVTKCHLLEHPCNIQVLDLPPKLKIFEADQGNSPMLRRVTIASLDKIRTLLNCKKR